MAFFLLWNTKEDILKNVGNRTASGPIDFHFCPHKSVGPETICFPAFFKISSFFQQKEMHTGLARHEGDINNDHIFGWSIPSV